MLCIIHPIFIVVPKAVNLEFVEGDEIHSIQIQLDELFQTTSVQLNLNTISLVHLRVFTIVLS